MNAATLTNREILRGHLAPIATTLGLAAAFFLPACWLIVEVVDTAEAERLMRVASTPRGRAEAATVRRIAEQAPSAPECVMHTDTSATCAYTDRKTGTRRYLHIARSAP